MQSSMIYPIKKLIQSLESEEFLIDEDRQSLLLDVSKAILNELREKGSAQLVVICTHNSRRSQVGEVWIRAAAQFYDLEQIEAYSGGTEQTSFNPRMVQALSRAGFIINLVEPGDNPRYHIHYAVPGHNQMLFSKVYDDEFNPNRDFIAILVCDQADEECPMVHGAKHRFFIPYTDPKRYDDQLDEYMQYDLTLREIGREFSFMIKNVAHPDA